MSPARALFSTNNICRAALLCLCKNERVHNGSDWLTPGEAGMWAMYPAVSEEKFTPTENAVGIRPTPIKRTVKIPARNFAQLPRCKAGDEHFTISKQKERVVLGDEKIRWKLILAIIS
jgi:hypothetical protein